jgi:hypothetical protein
MTDAIKVRDLYRTMSTDQLRHLRAAFEADRESAPRTSLVGFCDQRLGWIADVLRERHADEREPDEPPVNSFERFWESAGLQEVEHLRRLLTERRTAIVEAISAPVASLAQADALHVALAALHVLGQMDGTLARIEDRLRGKGDSL